MDLCWQGGTLFRFFVAFLPRSKRLLISWLQSPSTVILEPKKIKSVTISIFSLSICHEVMWMPWSLFFECWVLSQLFHSSLSVSGSNCCFLTCIQVSQEAGKVVWYSQLFKNSLVCCDSHSERLWCNQWSRSKCFAGISLVFIWSTACWQFDLWFLCLF